MQLTASAQQKEHEVSLLKPTCSSRSRISLRIVPVSSMVWISWLQFCSEWQRHNRRPFPDMNQHRQQKDQGLGHSDAPHVRQPGTCRICGQTHLSWHPKQNNSKGIYSKWNKKEIHYRFLEAAPWKKKKKKIVWLKISAKCLWEVRDEPATLKTSSSVTANVRSSFPVRLLISFCSSLVSDRIWGDPTRSWWEKKQRWHNRVQIISPQRNVTNSMNPRNLWISLCSSPTSSNLTLVISSFCFLILPTISKILWVYADRDTSWGRLSNSVTFRGREEGQGWLKHTQFETNLVKHKKKHMNK